jgi:hypothetical protein
VFIHRRDGGTENVIFILPADVAGDIPVIVGDYICHTVIDFLAGAAAGKPGLTDKSLLKGGVKKM